MKPTKTLIAVLAVLLLAACSQAGAYAVVRTPGQPHTTTTVTVTPAATPTDPYQTYLRLNPDPALVLSREDAQLRALLGCGTQFAPGTIDAVLASP